MFRTARKAVTFLSLPQIFVKVISTHVTFPMQIPVTLRYAGDSAMIRKSIGPMKTNYAQTKIVLLLLWAPIFPVVSARTETYAWTNLRIG